MMTFVLVLPHRGGEVVDSADAPHKLDFSKVLGHTCYEVRARFEFPSDGSDSRHPVAAVDLTGCMGQASWVIQQISDELDFRRAFPDFEDDVKRADGPLIAFGEPNIGPNGFIV